MVKKTPFFKFMCLLMMKMNKENVFIDDENEVSEGGFYHELSGCLVVIC